MITLYSLLLRCAVPVMLLRLLWRSRRNPDYRARLVERLAFDLPNRAPGAPAPLWVHAVSVGETLAIAPLVEALLNADSQRPVLMTSTTPTGAAQVRRLFGNRVEHCWVPFDTPGSAARFLNHWCPVALVLVETELWPNIIRACQGRHIPIMLANGRLSARSARGYARIGAVARPAIAALSVIACQQRADARRFRALGAREEVVRVAGSIKFDLPMPKLVQQRDDISRALAIGSGRWIWVAASTHRGEDELVLSAFKALKAQHPSALLILAPRHPERSAEIERDLLIGRPFRVSRRSQQQAVGDLVDILLLDTLGELAALTGLADAVFVGGSLIDHGGHNPLEAAAFGRAVISGPHCVNFATIYRDLRRCGGVREVASSQTLAAVVTELASDPALCAAMGDAGQDYVAANKGALACQYTLLEALLR